MARECEHCGVASGDGAENCELCGAALPRASSTESYPHRIPTGIRPQVPSGPPSRESLRIAVDSPASVLPASIASQLATGDPDATVRPRSGRPPLNPDETMVEIETDTRQGDTAAEPPTQPGTHVLAEGAAENGSVNDDLHEDETVPQDLVGERAADAAAAAGFTRDSRPPSGQTPAVGAEALRGKVLLQVEQGQIIGERYLLTEASTIIGRADPESAHYPDIDLSGQDNEYVHRHHARLVFYDVDTRLSVEHIGGHNVTLVNNQPVDEGELVELTVGDRLRVGRVVMRLKSL